MSENELMIRVQDVKKQYRLGQIGGGTLRDLLLGLPPFWMQNVSYLVVSGFAFLFVVGLRKYVIRLNNTFFIFDAVGLGLFTVVGIQKSIAVGYPMWVGIIMGTLTGAAGGMLRDVLLNEVPLIFRKDIYAIACICGGLIYYPCRRPPRSSSPPAR